MTPSLYILTLVSRDRGTRHDYSKPLSLVSGFGSTVLLRITVLDVQDTAHRDAIPVASGICSILLNARGCKLLLLEFYTTYHHILHNNIAYQS